MFDMFVVIVLFASITIAALSTLGVTACLMLVMSVVGCVLLGDACLKLRQPSP